MSGEAPLRNNFFRAASGMLVAATLLLATGLAGPFQSKAEAGVSPGAVVNMLNRRAQEARPQQYTAASHASDNAVGVAILLGATALTALICKKMNSGPH